MINALEKLEDMGQYKCLAFIACWSCFHLLIINDETGNCSSKSLLINTYFNKKPKNLKTYISLFSDLPQCYHITEDNKCTVCKVTL